MALPTENPHSRRKPGSIYSATEPLTSGSRLSPEMRIFFGIMFQNVPHSRNDSATSSSGPCCDQLHEVIHHIAAFDEFQPRLGDMPLGLPVEARAVGPRDPRLPNRGHNPPDSPVRTDIFQQPNKAARLDDPTQLP